MSTPGKPRIRSFSRVRSLSWELAGALCLAIFGVSLWRLSAASTDRAAAEADTLAPGGELRAGDEWIGLYFQDRKIGLTRISKTPQAEGRWEYRIESTLKLEALGVPAKAELELHAHLGADRALTGFQLALRTGAQDFRADGRVEGQVLHLGVTTAGERTERTLALPAPPILRDLIGPALAREALTPGRRLTLPGFDPWTLSASALEVEVVGPDTVVMMAQEVPATHIRLHLDGLILDAWLNERGEMLRQELPLGLVAVRQSEEEARWGMAGEAGLSLADSVELPVTPLPRPPTELTRLVLGLVGDAPLEGLHRPPGQVLSGSRLTLTRAPLLPGLPLPVNGNTEPELRAGLTADAVVQSDHPKIRAAGRARTAGQPDTVAAARALMQGLHDEMKFERRGGVPSAIETLSTLTGDCTETSALFAALARAAGVPTRVVFGLVYKTAPTPRFAWHAWNEVAAAGGWVSVDATWGQLPVDLGHIALVSGDFQRQAELLRIMGHLRLDVVDAQ